MCCNEGLSFTISATYLLKDVLSISTAREYAANHNFITIKLMNKYKERSPNIIGDQRQNIPCRAVHNSQSCVDSWRHTANRWHHKSCHS